MISERIRKQKDRISTLMDQSALDVVVASLPQNIYYLSGYESISRHLSSRVDVFYLYDRRNDRGTLIVPCAEAAAALEQTSDTKVLCYGTFHFNIPGSAAEYEPLREAIGETARSSTGALLQAIRAAAIPNGRLGMDEKRILPQIWLFLMEQLPNMTLIPASELFSRARMIKFEHEVHLLERAAEIAELALAETLKAIKPGLTELEMEQVYLDEVVRNGARPFFHVITAGMRSPLVDTINTDNRITEGTMIRFDIGCDYRGYKSDMSRTAFLGRPSEKLAQYYEAIRKGEEAALRLIKPGVAPAAVFHAAVTEVRNGIPHYKRHHCGHGIGLEGYDPPSIAPGVDEPLSPGMVLCIETPYYELGWGGIQVEDTVLVTQNGFLPLTKMDNGLIALDFS